MSACVKQFASYVNVLESALDMIDDDVSSDSLDNHSELTKVLNTIMEVNVMLVYRFQCGPVPQQDMADVRKKVTDLLAETQEQAQYAPGVPGNYTIA